MFPGLSGTDKMSSSDPMSTIYTTDDRKEVKKKVGKAFTGGCVSVDEQRVKGGNPEVCAVFKYNYYLFEEDDAKLNDITARCREGRILCGECKVALTEKINRFLEKHQEKREKAKDIIHEMSFEGFRW
jgi:tryptophanyl-tRNA synthetase